MITIVKVGGAIIEEKRALTRLINSFIKLKSPKILVHGGGRTSSKMMKKLGIIPTLINGRRVTDAQTLEIVTMTYSGINKQIVSLLQARKVNALGICGADGNTLQATKRSSKPIDFGFVGDIHPQKVNTDFFANIFSRDLTPVFAPLTHDGHGNLLNTNADTIASVLAQALQRIENVRLLYVFEKPGLLRDAENEQSLIEHFSLADYKKAQQSDFIHSGMHPKLKNAFDAISHQVHEVKLCNIENMIMLKKCTSITA